MYEVLFTDERMLRDGRRRQVKVKKVNHKVKDMSKGTRQL